MVLHKINISVVNPCHATVLFLYPLKSSKNQRFFYVLRGYRKRLVAKKWFNRHDFHIRTKHPPKSDQPLALFKKSAFKNFA